MSPQTQRYVIFVAFEGTSQADTILVGPYRSWDRAERRRKAIERKYSPGVAAMVMDLLPDHDALNLAGDTP